MDTVYAQLQQGVVPKDQQVIDRINEFLDKYPGTVSPDKKPDTPWINLSVKEIFKRCVQTMIDIINDLSEIVNNKAAMSNAAFRRRLFAAFTSPERRLYVGFWLIFVSFLLYFIDSTA
jgi:hypothetical protein